MEHFSIVQALCRTAMANGTPAVRRQIERLRDELSQQGERKQAESLDRLLNADRRTREVAPARIARSRIRRVDETLSSDTPLPVDRETSAPLAELLFPSDIQSDPPMFDLAVNGALETIVQEWTDPISLLTVGIDPPMSCLIHGAPGTGKTRLALWISCELDLPVVLARLDGLISSFLGTTARNIGNLFGFANRYRCMLLLDEFDAIAKLRDDPQEVGEIKRVVNALLQNLDARNSVGLTIGITNNECLLDPAVWRRFEVQLEIPKPDFRIRSEIARSFLLPFEIPNSHVRLMAWITNGRAGAEVEHLARAYKLALAYREQRPDTIIDTLRRFCIRNSARVDRVRSRLLSAGIQDLARALKNDPELCLTVTEIAEVAGKDKSTISRWLAG